MNFVEFNLQEIQERLRKIERQNNLFKIFGIVILLLASSMVIMAFDSSMVQIVNTKRLVLRGQDGTVLADLKASNMPDAGSVLTLFDQTGNPSIEMTAGGYNASLIFFSAEGNQRVIISPWGPTLSLCDSKGEIRLEASLKSAGEAPLFKFINSEGKTDAMIYRGNLGISIALLDTRLGAETMSGGIALTLIGTGPGGRLASPSLMLFDNTGETIWKIP